MTETSPEVSQPGPIESTPSPIEPPGSPPTLADNSGLAPDTVQGCEHIIRTRKQHFVTVGRTLSKIHDRRLYRIDFDTFEEYCIATFHLGRAHAYGLMRAAQDYTALLAVCPSAKPDSVSQLLGLAGLPSEQMKAVWQRAEQIAGGSKVTARIIQQVLRELDLKRQRPGRKRRARAAAVRAAASEGKATA